jgi:2-polyprenyl-3-methyl-5-hydroxy-6-metoxy-1,4-benzoquinol methylase
VTGRRNIHQVRRIPPDMLRHAASSVADKLQHDEMAGPSYLHRIPLIRWLFWRRLEVVAELLAAGGDRYEAGLDFGCGLGVLLPTLSNFTTSVYATDLELRPARQIVAAMEIPNVEFVPPETLQTRITPGSLDYVVSTDVLEHVDDLPAIVNQLASFLRRGGRLIISGPTESLVYRMSRVLAGFGGKGDYHHTDIHRIHDLVIATRAFQTAARRILPIPNVVEGFYIYSYKKS